MILVIGAAEMKAIRDAIEAARRNPLPWEVAQLIGVTLTRPHLDLNERLPGVAALRRKYPSRYVTLGAYRVGFSFESQPAGLFRHLSVSLPNEGTIPRPEIMQVIARKYGFSSFPPMRPGTVWNEEFSPGFFATNIVEIEPS
jgi:hypothetical protein